MPDREQQLTEAAMQYLTLLEGDRPVNIQEFVQSVAPELRDELVAYIEQILVIGQPVNPVVLTAEEQAIADRVATRSRERVQQRLSASPTPAVSLTALRTARKLPLGAVARQINLPPDLLARIERGGVVVATIPARLIATLASALGQAEAEIRAALAVPQLSTAAPRLSAQDGTVTNQEEAVPFADALAASGASPEQRTAWS